LLLRQQYRRILFGIVPAGAAGISLLLGTLALSAAADYPAGQPPLGGGPGLISERLAAIRGAVSEAAEAQGEATNPSNSDLRLAWGDCWNN
jgi:hypothetical protein